MEIKLPHLKIDYRQDDRFSLGKISLSLIMGFGIHWAWVYLTMFKGKAFFFWNSTLIEASTTLFYLSSLTFFILMLFSYGIFSRTFRGLFATPKQRFRNRFIGATLACAGTVCMCFANSATISGLLFLWIGGATTGIGSAILLISYGVSFGQCDIATIVTSTALSLLVGIVVYASLFNLNAFQPLPTFLIAVLPFVECYCLYRCSSTLIDKLEFASLTLKVRKTPFALRLCVPSILFGFALGSTRYEAIVDMNIIDNLNIDVICIIIGALVTCLLLIIIMLTQRQYFNFIFRSTLPLITLALVWAYFDHGQMQFLSTLIFLVCYLLFEGILWISYSDISQHFRLTAFIVFGFGRGSLALGALLGALVSATGTHFGITPNAEGMIIITLACMLIAYATLPTEREIKKLIINESDDPVDNKEIGQKPGDHKSEVTVKAGRFKRKCELIANRYLLSKKETEVLFLLAKGRNAAYIQEQLYISEGTTRTHMRHIYKKLNIHAQQELIDLIDTTDPGADR